MDALGDFGVNGRDQSQVTIRLGLAESENVCWSAFGRSRLQTCWSGNLDLAGPSQDKSQEIGRRWLGIDWGKFLLVGGGCC